MLINKLNETSKFKEFRSKYIYVGKNKYIDGFHEGIDLSSEKYKEQEIFCEISGVVSDKSYNRNSYGNKLVIKSDLSFLGKIFENDYIYGLYGHLDRYEDGIEIGKNVEEGEIIGYMGNTGFCLTKIDKIKRNGEIIYLDNYRRVTEEESKNKNFIGGIHLHLSFFVDKYEVVKKIEDLIENKKDLYIFQWGKYWFNPIKFIKFYKDIKG